jgi:hypothetical protein
MTTWIDKQKRFSLDVPQGWSCPGRLSLLFSSGYRAFRAPDRYLTIETGTSSVPPAAAASPVPVAWALREAEHESGSSPRSDGRQVWAVYRVPQRLIAEIPAAREILRDVLRAYADVVTGTADAVLAEFARKKWDP